MLACINPSLFPVCGCKVACCLSSPSLEHPTTMDCTLNCKLKQTILFLTYFCQGISSQQHGMLHTPSVLDILLGWNLNPNVSRFCFLCKEKYTQVHCNMPRHTLSWRCSRQLLPGSSIRHDCTLGSHPFPYFPCLAFHTLIAIPGCFADPASILVATFLLLKKVLLLSLQQVFQTSKKG